MALHGAKRFRKPTSEIVIEIVKHPTNYCQRYYQDYALNMGNSMICIPAYRVSFAIDVCRGMAQLHKRGIIHGQLKSTKCLVDSKWIVKITGRDELSMFNLVVKRSH